MGVRNNWSGVGRIANDLDIRITENGKEVLNFSVAINEGTKEKQYTTFVPCEAWEGLANTIYKYFKKGDQIILGGRLAVRKVNDRGQNRNSVSVVVDSIEWGAKKSEKQVNANDDVNYSENEKMPWDE